MQTALMLLKLVAIVMLIIAGAFIANPAGVHHVAAASTLGGFAAAMTPVMFAYGGWQTASFMSGELKRPTRDLAIGLLSGVAGVITVYLLVNVVCLRVLGAEGLAATTTPASAVMRIALGDRGAMLIAAGIAISTLGFLSQGMLTAPRVYYAMAEDRLFFRAIAKVHPKTRVPVVAIAVQGIVAVVIALSGTYEQILSYVVSVDFIFFGLTGLALFVFRKRLGASASFRTPGHPISTAVFTIACWLVVAGTIIRAPVNSAIGFGILFAGLPAYWFWHSRT
jgi:APA family basic amino acid/polyamine antiporter